MTDLNVGCGEFRAAPPWINVDVREDPPGTAHGTFPDQQITPGEYPFTGVTRLYLGHLLEHMTQDVVLEFLTGWHTTLTENAEVTVVGPDFNRALELYRRGELTRDALWQRGEPGAHQADVGFWTDYYKRELYLHPGYHRWSCTPERVIALLQLTGYREVREVGVDSPELAGWPLVSRSWDQFAVVARA